MYRRRDVVTHLKERGLLLSPAIERACLSVDLEAFLPQDLRPLAYANAPIPYSTRFRDTILPSPAILAALLQLLDLEPGRPVGVYRAAGGYPAAVIAHIVPDARIVVAEPEEDLRTDAMKNLSQAGLLDRVNVVPAFEGERFARILVLGGGRAPGEFMAHVANLGFVVSRGLAAEGLAFRKRVRSGDAELDLNVEEMPAGGGGGETRAASWARLLARDELIEHAWEGRVLSPADGNSANAIEETFRAGPLDSKAHMLNARQVAARRAFHAAYIVQHVGVLQDAADLYERSLALFPNSEGHTFLGWVHSFTGDLDRAVAECEKAIDVDPTFGNPYNDIGAYFIELERYGDAIPWLKKALASERYCCYFYAHTNLGRVYMLQGRQELARKHFEEALKVNPGYEPAREMLRRINSGIDYVA